MQHASTCTTPSPTPRIHSHIYEHAHIFFFFCFDRFDSGILCRNTPLHSSSGIGLLDVCQFLVEKGANVNATDDEYDTQPYVHK
jgi:hypothetical protein